MGISELSRMLKEGRVTSRELTLRYISRIERLNPALNAYVCTCFDYALACADRADEMIKRGESTPLTGIPMALKDNICTEGVATTCCSDMLRGHVPCYSAVAWQKLQASGAVLLGKTNMDEFAMGSSSETSRFGAPKNPIDPAFVAGGSSGGSAAAVAADLAVYALGSDTGGSVRQPASFCGVVGFRPTYGSVSRYGLVAYASSLDQIGPIARSAEDAALVFKAIRGGGPDTIGADSDDEISPDADVRSLTVGVIEELLSDGVEKDVRGAVLAAAKLFAHAGARVEKVSLPALASALPAYYIISCAEASSNLARYDGVRYGMRAEGGTYAESMANTRTAGFGKEVKRRIMLGTYVLSAGQRESYYKRACSLRAKVRRQFAAAFGRFDILLAPAAPAAAFPLGAVPASSVRAYLSDMCTVPASIAGLPAAVIPCGTAQNGLPIGLQIIGAPFSDGRVLACARLAEDFTGVKLSPYKGVAE